MTSGNASTHFGNTSMGMTGGLSAKQMMAEQLEEEEAEEMRANARKIGPFSFDIDDDIDTEVLTNEQVYDDLKELEDILEEGHSNMTQNNTKRR